MKHAYLIEHLAGIYKMATSDLETAPPSIVAYNAAARHYLSLIDWLTEGNPTETEELRRRAAPLVYPEVIEYYRAVISAFGARIMVITYSPTARKRHIDDEETELLTRKTNELIGLAKIASSGSDLAYVLDEMVKLGNSIDAFRIINPSRRSAKYFPVITRLTKEGIEKLIEYENTKELKALVESVIYTNVIDQSAHTTGLFSEYLYRGVKPADFVKMFDFKNQQSAAQSAKLTEQYLRGSGPLHYVARTPLLDYVRHNPESQNPIEYTTKRHVPENREGEAGGKAEKTREIEGLEDAGKLPRTMWREKK